MDTKKCFKYGRELPPLSFFISTPNLNKCKDCTRKDVSENISKKSSNPEWRRRARERRREKYHRLGYKTNKMHHPETRGVTRYFQLKGIHLCGCEFHHWNYNFLNDVIAIPISLHKKLHRLLKFDEESKGFLYNGTLLTTKKQHIELIKTLA